MVLFLFRFLYILSKKKYFTPSKYQTSFSRQTTWKEIFSMKNRRTINQSIISQEKKTNDIFLSWSNLVSIWSFFNQSYFQPRQTIKHALKEKTKVFRRAKWISLYWRNVLEWNNEERNELFSFKKLESKIDPSKDKIFLFFLSSSQTFTFELLFFFCLSENKWTFSGWKMLI